MLDQGESWVNLAGGGEIDPVTKKAVIGQIFFKTDEHALDASDREAVQYLAIGMKQYLSAAEGPYLKPFALGFVGWADYRGAAAYNTRLSERRALIVKDAFDEHFTGALSTPYWRQRYVSASEGAGEGKERDRSRLYRDRRVNIVSNRTFRPRMNFPPTEIRMRPRNAELSREFEIRTRIGGSAGIGPIGVGVLMIEIRNRRTGKTIKLSFAGAGGSAGFRFGANRPTEFERFETPYYLELIDFVGRGRITGVSAGVDGVTDLQFLGPVTNGRAPRTDILLEKPLLVRTKGWDLNVGVGGVEGLWEVSTF